MPAVKRKPGCNPGQIKGDNKMTKYKLKRRLAKMAGCSTQHNGWPCNTCFHALDLGLSGYELHQLWLSVLLYRGDYKRRDIIDETKEITDSNISKLKALLAERDQIGSPAATPGK